MDIVGKIIEFLTTFAEKDLSTLIVVAAAYFIIPYFMSLLIGEKSRKKHIVNIIDKILDENTPDREKKIDLIAKLYSEKKEEELKNELGAIFFKKKDSGFISRDMMFVLVPALIALSFTFVVIYLHVVNQSIPDYKTPEIFSSGLTTIIGYYFGVNVGSTTNDSSEIIKEHLKNMGIDV